MQRQIGKGVAGMTPERRAKYWLALQMIFGQGSACINDIVDRFGTAVDFFRAGEEAWKEIAGIEPRHLKQLSHPDTNAVDKILSACRRAECYIVTPEDEEYPEPLRHIYGMPAALYVLGDLRCLRNRLAIAMVGTRNCTAAGLSVADRIALELARERVVVVSGMAKGIDSACHWGALKGGSATVAVLSCGLDQIYPPENITLWSQIRAKGAVVSEYPPGTSVTRASFHTRNRLISGMARGVVMVEGSQRSGTTITINHGLEQGKEIFVIPWNTDTEAGRWAVELLRQGAIAVASGKHILEEYGYDIPSRFPESEAERDERRENLQETLRQLHPRREKREKAGMEPVDASEKEKEVQPQEPPKLEGNQKLVYELLSEEGLYCDVLSQQSGLDIGALTAVLTELEMLGIAQAMPGGRYRRV